jgi:hypothetical protein
MLAFLVTADLLRHEEAAPRASRHFPLDPVRFPPHLEGVPGRPANGILPRPVLRLAQLRDLPERSVRLFSLTGYIFGFRAAKLPDQNSLSP